MLRGIITEVLETTPIPPKKKDIPRYTLHFFFSHLWLEYEVSFILILSPLYEFTLSTQSPADFITNE